MRSLKPIVIAMLVLSAVALAAAPGAFCEGRQQKRNGPVILMLDPQGKKLDTDGRLSSHAVRSSHRSSVIVFADGNGQTLGIAEVPGLASDHLITTESRSGVREVLAVKDGKFKHYLEIAKAAIGGVLELGSPIYDDDGGYCGYTNCFRQPGGELECRCVHDCLDCYYVPVTP